jgi:hypothetical protein
MINFFRKIRKQLADDNKPLKYMRYAIGEIVLVVIGILIALSINNWNEKQKLKKIEIKILKEMKLAINDDIERLNYNIKTYNSVKRAIEIIIEQLPLETPTSDSLQYAFQQSLFNNKVLPNTGAYETLKAKGIDLISNDSLRIQIIDVYEKKYKYFQDSAQNLFLSESFIQEYCATLFNNLDYFSNENTMVPNNYVALQKDTLYNTIINTRLSQVTFSLMSLTWDIEIVQQLDKTIMTEIKRLEE